MHHQLPQRMDKFGGDDRFRLMSESGNVFCKVILLVNSVSLESLSTEEVIEKGILTFWVKG
jgi:hypothetical protein